MIAHREPQPLLDVVAHGLCLPGSNKFKLKYGVQAAVVDQGLLRNAAGQTRQLVPAHMCLVH